MRIKYDIEINIDTFQPESQTITGRWSGQINGKDDCQEEVKDILNQKAMEVWDNASHSMSTPLANGASVRLYHKDGTDCSGDDCLSGTFDVWIII